MSDYEDYSQTPSEAGQNPTDFSSADDQPHPQNLSVPPAPSPEMPHYSPYQAPQYQQNGFPRESASVPPVPPLSSAAFRYAVYPPAPTYSYPPPAAGYAVPPYYPAVGYPRRTGEGLSIASLVLGILSMFLFWIPFFGLVLSLLALVLGIVAKVKGSGGMAIAGIVLGIFGILLSFLVIALIVGTFSSLNQTDFSYYNNGTDTWSNYTAVFHLH